MKIIDNNEKKKGFFSNKKAITAVCSMAALLVICVGVFAFIGAGKGDKVNANSNDSVEDVGHTKVEDLDITKPEGGGNGLSIQGVSVKNEDKDDQVEDLGVTTGIYTEREDLLDLVINTMYGMNERFGRYSEECEAFKTVLDELNKSSFINANQLNGKTGLNIEECEGLKNLTWLDVCGSIGAAVFNELEDPYMHPANYKSGQEYLSHAIAYGVYEFELKKDEMEIEEKTTYSIEISGEQFDVNFEVHFEYNGVQYTALIGNVNGGYVVLDVVKIESVDGVEEVTGESTTQSGSGDVAEQIPNETTPDVPQTTQKPEAQPTVPPNSTGYYDPNDPKSGLPGYEGPKEGYVYFPGIGYIEVGGERPYDMPCDPNPVEMSGEKYPGADM